MQILAQFSNPTLQIPNNFALKRTPNNSILYQSMERAPAELLAQGFAKIIVEHCLKLDGSNSKYRLRVQNEGKVIVPLSYEQMEYQALCRDNNFYYQELGIDDSSEQTAFEYYFLEQKSKIQRQNPSFTLQQIRTKAANNFKNLLPSQKLNYLKQYLKQNKYKNKAALKENNSQVPTQYLQGYLYGSFNPFGLAEGASLIPSLFDHVDNSYSRRDKQIQGKDLTYFDQTLKDRIQEENPSINKKITNANQSTENRGKNDINKGGAQASDKKNDESKEKAEFQTLKSLFKRLQSNT